RYVHSALFFISAAPATTALYTLSLHDALPICPANLLLVPRAQARSSAPASCGPRLECRQSLPRRSSSEPWPLSAARNLASSACADRKSTRLNSSHDQISYAVFCLKKKNLKSIL